MAVPLVASDFSGLGQLQAGREARAQQAEQAQLARMLALQQMRQQQAQQNAYRQQRAQEFAQQLALTQAANEEAKRQYEMNRADVLRQNSQSAAERALGRADRATELREAMDFQRELALGQQAQRNKVAADTVQRAVGDQLYRQLLGDISSNRVKDLPTLNQRSTSAIDYGQHEQLMHELAAQQESNKEVARRSKEAAETLNALWKARSRDLKDPKMKESSFASFLTSQPKGMMELVQTDDVNQTFAPFATPPSEDALEWRRAAYTDPIPPSGPSQEAMVARVQPEAIQAAKRARVRELVAQGVDPRAAARFVQGQGVGAPIREAAPPQAPAGVPDYGNSLALPGQVGAAPPMIPPQIANLGLGLRLNNNQFDVPSIAPDAPDGYQNPLFIPTAPMTPANPPALPPQNWPPVRMAPRPMWVPPTNTPPPPPVYPDVTNLPVRIAPRPQWAPALGIGQDYTQVDPATNQVLFAPPVQPPVRIAPRPVWTPPVAPQPPAPVYPSVTNLPIRVFRRPIVVP